MISTLCAFSNLIASKPVLIQTVEEISSQLSAEMGSKVNVDPKLRNVRVYFVRRDVGSVEALEILGKCVVATIFRGNSGYEIMRTPDDNKKIQDHVRSIRSEWIRRQISSIQKYQANVFRNGIDTSLVANELRNSASAAIDAMNGKSIDTRTSFASQLLPGQDLIIGLVERIGVEKFAALPTAKKAVFEDNPSGGATALPPHHDLDEIYSAHLSTFRKKPLDQSARQAITNLFEDEEFLPLVSNRGVSSKLRLSVSTESTTVRIRLDGFTSKGIRTFTSALACGAQLRQFTPAAYVLMNSKVPSRHLAELSNSSLSALRWLKSPQFSVPEWLITPQKDEPLNLFVRDAITGLAAKQMTSRPFAFMVSDSLFQNVQGCVIDGKIDIDAFQKTISDWDPFEAIDDKQCQIWRPIDVEGVESRNADRSALGRYAVQATRAKRLDYRMNGELYAKASRNPHGLPIVWHDLFARVLHSSQVHEPRISISALIGAMSPTQWRELIAGKSFTAQQLRVSEEVRHVLFDDTVSKTESEFPHSELESYPNEVMQNLDYADLRISVSPEIVNFVRRWNANEKEDTNDWYAPGTRIADLVLSTPYSIYSLRSSDRPSMERSDFEALQSRVIYRTGKADALKLYIILPDGFRVSTTLLGDIIAAERITQYSDLSEEQRLAIWQKASEISAQSVNAIRKLMQDKRQTPPPKKVIDP